MKKAGWILTMAAVAVSAPAIIAQQGQGSGSGSGGTSQGQRRTTTVTATPQPAAGISMTNVRLELTITDQTGSGQPIKKLISLLLAERGSGRVRSQGMVYVPRTGESPRAPSYAVELNADATILRIDGDRVRVMISVEYAPAAPEGGNPDQRGSPLNQTVDVVLENGKPTVIVEAADPLTDRKVTLQATATFTVGTRKRVF